MSNLKNKGSFIDFLLPFMENGQTVSNETQAEFILLKAKELLSKGAKGVAIIYSANFGQTRKIEETYEKGAWNTETGGSNQAAVMAAMEKLLGSTGKSLQGKLRIAPITTMTYTDFGGKTQVEVVADDLERMEELLKNGWDVLGWMNQLTAPNYAIGGGIAASLDANGLPLFPDSLSELVQAKLRQFSVKYPDPKSN